MVLSSTPPATYIYIIGHKRAHYLLLLPYITFPCAPNGGYPKVRSPQSSKIKQCKNSGTAVSTKLLFNLILYLSSCFFPRFVVVWSVSGSCSDTVFCFLLLFFVLFRVCVLYSSNTKLGTAQSSSLARELLRQVSLQSQENCKYVMQLFSINNWLIKK